MRPSYTLPIVVSQNCSRATSCAMLAPINTAHSMFSVVRMVLDIRSSFPSTTSIPCHTWTPQSHRNTLQHRAQNKLKTTSHKTS